MRDLTIVAVMDVFLRPLQFMELQFSGLNK